MEWRLRPGVEAATAVFVVVVVLVVGAVGLVSFTSPTGVGISSSESPTVLGTTTATLAAPCSSPIPEDPIPSQANESGINNSHFLANGSMRSLAFTMQAGATAPLCVTYSANGNVSADELTADALIVNATGHGNGWEYSYSKAPNISLNLTSLSTTSTGGSVVYTITTAKSAQGFYSFNYPGQCGLIPFAVISGNSQHLSSSEFPRFFVASTCPLFGLFGAWSQMTGFSGMTAVWLMG